MNIRRNWYAPSKAPAPMFNIDTPAIHKAMEPIKVRIELDSASKPIKISELFPNGNPSRDERKQLKQSFKSLFKKNNKANELSSNNRLDESTAPFVSVDTLGKATDLLNVAGNALGQAISGIQFKPVTAGKDFKVTTYGDLTDFHIDINGKKEGKSSLGKAVVNIEKLNNAVSGLDALVKDGFSSLTPRDEITGNNQQQTVSYDTYTKSGSSVNDDTDFKIEVKAYEPILGAKVFDVTFKGDFRLSSPYATANSKIDSIIDYNSATSQASLGNYSMSALAVQPSMAQTWGQYWDYVFGDVSKWWDDKISKKSNPFTYIDEAVEKQLTSGEDLLTNQVESIITDQLNSSSIKPLVDTAFQPLYGFAWDKQTYPLSGWTNA